MTKSKHLWRIAVLAIALLVAVNCVASWCGDSAAYAASKLQLNKKSITMTTGTSSTLSLKNADGEKISASKITWTTSSKSIVTVTKGKLKAVKPGTATIKAKYKGKTYSCKVTVKNASFVSKTLDMEVGGKTQTLVLRNALNKDIAGDKITWNSSDTSVAIVSSKGKVTALGSGTAVIKAKYAGKTYKATVNVTDGTAVQAPAETDQNQNPRDYWGSGANMIYLAGLVAEKGTYPGNDLCKYVVTGTNGDEIAILYYFKERKLTFRYVVEVSGLEGVCGVDYNLETETWSPARYTVIGRSMSMLGVYGSMETVSAFDAATYYSGKDIGYAVKGKIYQLDEASLARMANTTTSTMWAAMSSLLGSIDNMTLKHIGFENY